MHQRVPQAHHEATSSVYTGEMIRVTVESDDDDVDSLGGKFSM